MLKNGKFLSYDVETVECSMGQLTFNPYTASMLGAGAFKTAHPGWLTLFSPPLSGLRSQTCHDVAVKRTYYKANPQGTGKASVKCKIGRYALADEVPKLLKEGNVLYWARSLLQLTHDFIDRSIISVSELPPFKIPQVRSVDAGLAFAFGPLPAPKASSLMTGSAHAVYLVEELIPGGNEDFLKYVHNMDSNPLLDESDDSYDLALFFTFTQHIQYVKILSRHVPRTCFILHTISLTLHVAFSFSVSTKSFNSSSLGSVSPQSFNQRLSSSFVPSLLVRAFITF
jgi:hypothetical protein